jgi:hypothetical protein
MKREMPFDDCSNVADRIDDRCDAFESAWRNGERPNIGAFIDLGDNSYRNKLFCELLLVDVEWRRSLGEQPTAEHYLREFPEFTSQVDAVGFLYGKPSFSANLVNGDTTAQAVVRRPGSRVAHFKLVERLGAERWEKPGKHGTLA